MGKNAPIIKEVTQAFGGPAGTTATAAGTATQQFAETQAAMAPIPEDPTDPPKIEEVRTTVFENQRQDLKRRRSASTFLSGASSLDQPATASTTLLGF